MTRLEKDSTFAQEADDLLTRIEDAALALEASPEDAEHVNLLFRAFHTLKGSSAMVGLTEISSFTHHVESSLDGVRNGSMAVSAELVSIILRAKDHVQALLRCALDGGTPDLENGQAIIAALAALGGSGKVAHAPAASSGPRMRTSYAVTFRLKVDPSTIGLEAGDLVEELKALGKAEVRELAPATEELSIRYEVTLTTEQDENALRDVFIFAPQGSELLIEQGLSEFVTEPPPAPAAPPSPPRGKALAAPEAPAKSSAERSGERAQETVRVSSERLDQLMKLVGELVINQSRLMQVHSHLRAPELAGPVESMERLIGELRERVFNVRMMPIGPTFARFKRLARDLSTQLNKEIELVTEGDDTELDKTLIEQLGDPLVHLIRNAMDHGIELPEQRLAAGKPRKGRVRLSAVQDGGQVLITIADDGKGLDKQAIFAKAVEKGLISAHAQLTDQEIFGLIMQPGFSTAQAVTQLSGRGVGMDVVKKTIEGLRGSLRISSEPGVGTTMILALPLTLAIVEGLVVKVENDSFIIPMAAVLESVELPRAERLSKNRRNAIAIRGELVPYLRIRELFQLDGPELPVEMVVVASIAGQRVGLVVDRVVGLHQTVVQPLGSFCKDVSLFSGSTIMGDGRVVLILDLPALVAHAERRKLASQTFTGASHNAPNKESNGYAPQHQS